MNMEILTLAEAATDAGVEPSTLRHHAEKGTLKAIKKGKTWLTTKEAVEAWKREVHNPNMKRAKKSE